MGLDLDDLKQYHAKVEKKLAGESAGRPGYISLSDKTRIRIMPPHQDMRRFFTEIRVHYGVGEDEEKIYCPKMDGKKCPVCSYVKKLYKSGDSQDREFASRIGAKSRYLCNVIDVDDTKAGVQKFEFGIKTLNPILGIINDPDFGDITDQLTGRVLTITKTMVKDPKSKREWPNYDIRAGGKPSSIKNTKAWKSLLKKLNNLDEEAEFLTTEEIKGILYEDDDVDESYDTAKSERKPKAKKEVVIDEDDLFVDVDDDDINIDGEEDEVEEKPKPKPKAKKPKAKKPKPKKEEPVEDEDEFDLGKDDEEAPFETDEADDADSSDDIDFDSDDLDFDFDDLADDVQAGLDEEEDDPPPKKKVKRGVKRKK